MWLFCCPPKGVREGCVLGGKDNIPQKATRCKRKNTTSFDTHFSALLSPLWKGENAVH
nr:MAG TPA: hypothetical protein [Caudoviricetes sp.]